MGILYALWILDSLTYFSIPIHYNVHYFPHAFQLRSLLSPL